MLFILIVTLLTAYVFGIGFLNILLNTILAFFGLPTLTFGITFCIVLAIKVIKILTGNIEISSK